MPERCRTDLKGEFHVSAVCLRQGNGYSIVLDAMVWAIMTEWLALFLSPQITLVHCEHVPGDTLGCGIYCTEDALFSYDLINQSKATPSADIFGWLSSSRFNGWALCLREMLMPVAGCHRVVGAPTSRFNTKKVQPGTQVAKL